MTFARDPSLDTFATDDLLAPGNVTVEGEWTFLRHIAVSIHLGYVGLQRGATVFSDLDTSLALHAMQIGAQVGYRLWDAFTPYVRGGLSLGWAKASIGAEDDELESWSFSPGAYVMGGAELTLPRRWMRRLFRADVVTLGVLFEAGYVFSGRFEYPGEEDGSGLVPHQDAALGTLDLSGAAMRLGLLLSF